MKKALKVISVDGTIGSGKTSQINMLSKYLKDAGLKVSILKSGAGIAEIITTLKLVDSLLSKDPKSLVIVDGSIARPMVTDLVSGVPSNKVMDDYKEAMHEYEKVDKKYGVVGLLFVMDEIEEARKRLLKFSEFTGIENNRVQALDRESDIVSGMKTFNNHIATKNILFHEFYVHPDTTIMQLNREVVSYLTDKYDMPTPKKDENDW